jgi:hypothetical protein
MARLVRVAHDRARPTGVSAEDEDLVGKDGMQAAPDEVACAVKLFEFEAGRIEQNVDIVNDVTRCNPK